VSDAIAEHIPTNELYRLLLQSMPGIAVLVFDKDMRCPTAEGTFLSAWRYDKDQFIGKTVQEVFPDELERLSVECQTTLNGAISESEVAIDQFICCVCIAPVKDDTQRIFAGMIIIEDITKQKGVEQALRQSETQYRLLAKNSSDVIVQLNLADEYVYVSPASSQILGYSPSEMLGRSALDFIHAEDTHLTSHATHIVNPSVSSSAVVRFRHKDGHYVWIERSSEAVYSRETNDLIGFVSTYRDVTGRHRAEEKLRDSEAQLQLLVENSLDAIIFADRESKIIRVNPAACKMFGRSEAELRALGPNELLDLSDNRYDELTQTLLRTGRGRALLTGRRSDGTLFPVGVTSTMLNSDPEAIQSWTILHDLSDLYLYHQTLVQREKLKTALEKETELGQLKSRMMERISHEFRTPFATIMLTVELITKYIDHLNPAQVTEKVSTIYAQIHRLTDMLDEIDLAIRGKLLPTSLELTSIDLSVLCREIAQELELQFAGSGKYRLDLPESLLVSGDPIVLKQIFFHVLQNAARFSASAGEVNVSLGLHNDNVELRVTDHGLGILEDEQGRIFEPFFRGSNIGETKGLGLGLTLVRNSVAAYKGEIQITSLPNEGTTVFISLPQHVIA
jgi:PAS domain S-box-containing protein